MTGSPSFFARARAMKSALELIRPLLAFGREELREEIDRDMAGVNLRSLTDPALLDPALDLFAPGNQAATTDVVGPEGAPGDYEPGFVVALFTGSLACGRHRRSRLLPRHNLAPAAKPRP